MSFTAKLGTANSRPANLILGGSGGPRTINVSASDTLSFNETAIGVIIACSDTLVFTSTFSLNTILVRTLTDTLTLTDSSASIKLGDWTDTLNFSDTMSAAHYVIGIASDTLVFNDVLTRTIIANRTLAESLVLTEQLLRNLIRVIQASDTLSFSEATIGNNPKRITDTLTFVETWTAFVSKNLRELLEFNEQYRLNANWMKYAADVLELFDSLRLNLYMRLSVNETLNLSDVAFAIRTIPLSDIITLADNLVATNSKIVKDTITFTDLLFVNKATGVLAQDVIVFDDDADHRFAIRKTIEESLVLTDRLIALRARFFNISDSISFLDKLYREIRTATAPDTLVFTSSFSNAKVATRALNDILLFGESPTRQIIATRSIEDTLGFQDRCYATTDDYMVFIGQTRSVLMKPPEWNDYEADRSQIIFKRKMGGTVSTYKRTCKDQKIHYDFVMGRPKAYEFIDFLDEENGRAITIYDWKGQIWIAKLLTDTIEKVEIGRWNDCVGNKTRISLDFIGTRYA